MHKKLYPRELYLKKIRPFYHENDLIKVITGVRRCGKSSLMQLIAKELIKSGVDENNIIYLNLDKRPYRRVKKADQLEDILASKLDPIKGDKFLFIDEIQNVKDFEEVINAFREDDNCSIFITGSNSKLLSKEFTKELITKNLAVCCFWVLKVLQLYLTAEARLMLLKNYRR